MITIREIAALSGVSRSTVSLVLNNSPRVRPETRERVLSVIRQTGYVPNPTARSLGWRATKSLGVVILSDRQRTATYDFDQSVGLFSLSVMRGVSDRLSASGYSMIIEYFTPCGAALPRLLRERRIDGALMIGGYVEDAFVRACLRTGLPLAFAGVGLPALPCDAVSADPEDATCEALWLLYRSGRKHPVLINSPAAFPSSAPRVAGMRRFCEAAGIPFEEARVLYSRGNHGAGAYEACAAAWQSGLRFDALVSANPQSALGAMRFLSERGLRVPRDVAVIAYEDNALCGYAAPPLTAYNIQKERMGAEAAGLLLSRLQAPALPVRRLTVPCFLVRRGSL